MWPHKLFRHFSRPTLIVRLGASDLQLWSRKSAVLSHEKTISCNGIRFGQWNLIADSLQELLTDMDPESVVDAIVDTKWMPMSLLSVGTRPLKRQTLEALAHHRFSDIFGDHTKTWLAQVDYRPGDSHGLAFACPKELLDAIRQATAGDGNNPKSRPSLRSIQSTFVWINNTRIRGREKADNSCVVLREQDRSIFTFLRRGQIIGLHPMGPVIDRQAIDLAKEADILAKRCGLAFEELPIRVFSIDSVVGEPAPGSRWTVLQHQEHAA